MIVRVQQELDYVSAQAFSSILLGILGNHYMRMKFGNCERSGLLELRDEIHIDAHMDPVHRKRMLMIIREGLVPNRAVSLSREASRRALLGSGRRFDSGDGRLRLFPSKPLHAMVISKESLGSDPCRRQGFCIDEPASYEEELAERLDAMVERLMCVDAEVRILVLKESHRCCMCLLQWFQSKMRTAFCRSTKHPLVLSSDVICITSAANSSLAM